MPGLLRGRKGSGLSIRWVSKNAETRTSCELCSLTASQPDFYNSDWNGRILMSPVLQQKKIPLMPNLIGQTPLIRLRLFERDIPGIEVYAKAEWRNPGGSVKDRAARRIVWEAEERGDLTVGKVLLDATSARVTSKASIRSNYPMTRYLRSIWILSAGISYCTGCFRPIYSYSHLFVSFYPTFRYSFEVFPDF